MEFSVRQAIIISATLSIFAMTLLLMTTLLNSGYSFLHVIEEKKQFNQELSDYRDLARFDGREVTADDIIIAVRQYTRIYDFSIEITNSSENIVLTKDDVSSNWYSDSLRDKLKFSLHEKYRSNLVRDPDSQEVTGFYFEIIEEGED